MIQTIQIGSELFSNILMIFLLAWVIARVLEVWLNVYDRLKNRKRE